MIFLCSRIAQDLGERRDVDRSVCSVKNSLKFYDLTIYGKMLVQCKKVHVQSWYETTQNLPLNIVSLLRLCDHGLVRIVCNLTVKKYFGSIILVAVSERHKLDVLLIPPFMHVHRFLIYLRARFTRFTGFFNRKRRYIHIINWKQIHISDTHVIFRTWPGSDFLATLLSTGFWPHAGSKRFQTFCLQVTRRIFQLKQTTLAKLCSTNSFCRRTG